MRIIIDNSGYELKNFGDVAMLQIAVSRIQKLFPKAALQIFTTHPEALETFCPGALPVPSKITMQGRQQWLRPWNVVGGLNRLLPKILKLRLRLYECTLRAQFHHTARSWISFRYHKRGIDTAPMDKFLSMVQSCDLVVATGGGYITDAFENHASMVLGTLALAQSLGKPTFMFGQGVGPLQSTWLQLLGRKVLPRLNGIALREQKSGLPLLISLGVPEEIISITGDDAIELAYTAQQNTSGDGIGINLRMAPYSDAGLETLNTLRHTLKNIEKQLKVPLVPIPISSHDGDSDYTTLRHLLNEEHHAELNALDRPEKIINQVGKCRVMVTGSYHAGVFALSQGIPIVGLAKSQYYQDKFSGLSDQFPGGCKVVDMSQQYFGKQLEELILTAWQSAPNIRQTLLLQAQQQIEKSQAAYQKLRVLSK